MKQTRSLSDISCLSKYTRLYPNIKPGPSSRSPDIACTLIKINEQLTQFWNILPFFSLNMTNMSQINHVQDSLIFIVAEIFCSGCFRLDEYQIKDDNRIKLPVFNKLPNKAVHFLPALLCTIIYHVQFIERVDRLTNEFFSNIFTSDRRQSKTLILSTNVDKKVRNRVFDCHLSPDWRQMAIENAVLANFDPSSSIVMSVFDCRLSDVILSIHIRCLSLVG